MFHLLEKDGQLGRDSLCCSYRPAIEGDAAYGLASTVLIFLVAFTGRSSTIVYEGCLRSAGGAARLVFDDRPKGRRAGIDAATAAAYGFT